MRHAPSETHPDVDHMAKALFQAIQFARTTRQKVERDLGYSRGYLSKVLNGTVELRSRHVFEILDLIGMKPWEFFQLAFPPPQSRAPEKSAPEAAEPAVVSETELDERIRKGLLKILMGARP